MISRTQSRRFAMLASLVIGMAVGSPGVFAEPPAQGENTTITQEGDGHKSTTTKNGKVTNEKHTDKDGHLTKETDYDDKGKKEKETDYEWDAKAKRERKTKETTYRDDNGEPGRETEFDENEVISCETFYDESGGRVRLIYHAGKPVRWEKWDPKKKQWVFHHAVQGRIAPPSVPPVFTPGGGEVLQGVVIAAPETAAAGSPIAFHLVSLKGEVLANKPVRITGDNGQTVTATTDGAGGASALIPNGWKDAVIDALGSHSFVSLAQPSGNGLVVTQAPPIVQPGTVASVHGTGFVPSLDGNSVQIGKSRAIVLGASPTCITYFVPKDVSTGPQDLYVFTGRQQSPPAKVTVVDLQFEPGPSTLLAGQNVTRTLAVLGTDQPLRIRIDDPPTDGATILNAGYQTSTGGKRNVLPISVQAVRPGSYSAIASLNFHWPEFDIAEILRRAHVERARKKAENAAAEANKNDYFADGSTEAKTKAKNRAAAAAWRGAAKKWAEAMSAWAEGDADAALAAEAAARDFEAKAASALR